MLKIPIAFGGFRILLPLISFGVLLVLVNLAYGQPAKQKRSADGKKIESSSQAKRKSGSLKKKEAGFACDLGPWVVAIDLDQTEILLGCSASDKNCSNSRVIKVRTTAIDAGGLKYLYSVSAGKIIGEGANVEWDLSDVKAGTYTITAAVSDVFNGTRWEVYGTPKTTVIVVKE